MKRYAIVRVDNNCPFVTEGMNHIICEKVFNCDEFYDEGHCSNKCNYGDTKEQLIRKIETAITIWCNKGFYNKEHLARRIVEFLGVEE